jgi:hypothetical protein
MRKTLYRLVATVLILLALFGFERLVLPPAVGIAFHRTLPEKCDNRLWQFVHPSEQLKMVQECVTVTGIVDSIGSEGALGKQTDNYQFLLKPDPGYRDMVDGLNLVLQQGDLVIQMDCARLNVKSEAAASCQGIANSIVLPEVGDHIQVTGSFVYNPVFLGKFGWNEIRPVSDIASVEK